MMEKESKIYNLGVLDDKTYSFALRIIKAYKYLNDKNIYVFTIVHLKFSLCAITYCILVKYIRILCATI